MGRQIEALRAGQTGIRHGWLTAEWVIIRTPAPRRKPGEIRRIPHEAHLPAEQARQEAPSWFPCPHGDCRWTQGALSPPGPWAQEAFGLSTPEAPRKTIKV